MYFRRSTVMLSISWRFEWGRYEMLIYNECIECYNNWMLQYLRIWWWLSIILVYDVMIWWAMFMFCFWWCGMTLVLCINDDDVEMSMTIYVCITVTEDICATYDVYFYLTNLTDCATSKRSRHTKVIVMYS